MDSINFTDRGLFLEDTEQWLTWGTFVKKLVGINNAKVSKLGDRIIINWGRHSIFGGLEVKLTTTYLTPVLPFFTKRLKIIEHWSYGDKDALTDFERISSHLLKVFGEPAEKKGTLDNDREIEWSWRIKETKVTLYLFEQHAYKLVLSIAHE